MISRKWPGHYTEFTEFIAFTLTKLPRTKKKKNTNLVKPKET